MTALIMVLIVVACIILSFFILIQKPKGGGLSGAFGSVGAQVMGVKQSGDAMEKGTWITMAVIAILSIASVFTLPRTTTSQQQPVQEQQQQQNPSQQQQGTPLSNAG